MEYIMKKNITRFLPRISALCCASALAFVSFTPLTAQADSKSYRTDEADFDIRFDRNGAATITESWTVTYTSGSFTRFSKDIYNPGNQLEYMPVINV